MRSTQDRESQLLLRSPRDYFTVQCFANNPVGHQDSPCISGIIPSGPPDPPFDCSVGEPDPFQIAVIACLNIIKKWNKDSQPSVTQVPATRFCRPQLPTHFQALLLTIFKQEQDISKQKYLTDYKGKQLVT